MRCPKCGFENPQGTLFCEECDWRMDQPVKYESAGFPRESISMIAAVLGLISVLLWYFDVTWGAMVAGAIGMVLGGYSITFVRLADVDKRTVLIVASALAICLSVVGFILGMGSL